MLSTQVHISTPLSLCLLPNDCSFNCAMAQSEGENTEETSLSSLVAPWLRICLLMQGHGFDSWSGDSDPTCYEVTMAYLPQPERVCSPQGKSSCAKTNTHLSQRNRERERDT